MNSTAVLCNLRAEAIDFALVKDNPVIDASSRELTCTELAMVAGGPEIKNSAWYSIIVPLQNFKRNITMKILFGAISSFTWSRLGDPFYPNGTVEETIVVLTAGESSLVAGGPEGEVGLGIVPPD